MEEWKVINGYENYKISNYGSVLNLKTGNTLKPWYTNGYQCIYLYNDEGRKKYKVHRLVALHFIPLLEKHPHVNHIDGDKENNKEVNLEWVTPKQNSAHSIANNLQGRGKRIAKETKEKIMLEYENTNISQPKLAEKYDVSLKTIERWRYEKKKKLKKV